MYFHYDMWCKFIQKSTCGKLPLHLHKYTRASSLWCLYSLLINYAWACLSCGNFINRAMLLTKKLVDQRYTLAKLQIYFRKFYGRLQYYSFAVCVGPCPLLMCVTYTEFYLIGDYRLHAWIHGAWPHQLRFNLLAYLFTHEGFPECLCCLECNIC